MNGFRNEFPDLVPTFAEEVPRQAETDHFLFEQQLFVLAPGGNGDPVHDALGFARVAEEAPLVREERGVCGGLHSLIQVSELFCAVRIDGV